MYHNMKVTTLEAIPNVATAWTDKGVHKEPVAIPMSSEVTTESYVN